MEEAAPPEGPRGPDARPGCARAIAIACGAILILAAIAATGLALRLNRVISSLEISFVRTALARSKADGEVRRRVEAVLDEYQQAARAADLRPDQWWAAGRAFERSPAAAVLEALVILADLGSVEGIRPPDLERGRDAWTRVVRGLAEGKLSPEEYRRILARAAGHPDPAAEDQIHIEVFALSPELLRRLIEEADKLAAERGVPGGPFEPDLPALIRRDLVESLESGKK